MIDTLTLSRELTKAGLESAILGFSPQSTGLLGVAAKGLDLSPRQKKPFSVAK